MELIVDIILSTYDKDAVIEHIILSRVMLIVCYEEIVIK